MYDWQDKDWKKKRDRCLEFATTDGIVAEISNSGLFVTLYSHKNGLRERICDLYFPSWHSVGLITVYGKQWEKIGSSFSPEEAYEVCKAYYLAHIG